MENSLHCFVLCWKILNFATVMNISRKYSHIIILCLLLLTSVAANAVEKKQDPSLTLKVKGDACYEAGRYSDALEFYTKALESAKNEKNDQMYYVCLGNIGNIYASMNDIKRALHYYTTGYEAAKQANDIDRQWGFTTNIVAAYCMIHEADNAKAFFDVQMKIPYKDTKIKRYYFLNNQAYIAMAENNSRMAEYYFKKVMAFAQERQLHTMYYVGPLVELGKIYLQGKNSREAIECLETARDSVFRMENKDRLVSIYQAMSEAYRMSGNADSAEAYRRRYLAMSDSIFNISQFNLANGKLFEYENKENKARIDSLTSQNYIQLFVILVFVVFALAVTLLYVALRRKTRNLQEAQKMLVSKNEELMASDSHSRQLLKRYVEAMDKQKIQTGTEIPDKGMMQDADNGTESIEEHEDQRTGLGLNEELRNRLLNSITTILEDVSVISNSDFNLSMLAEKAGSNTKYVSSIINDVYGKNFKTVLNEYRIREACRRLTDKDHYGNMTIQAIYEELGYNSAASFIQAFKKVNGMTPSVYQKLKSGNSLEH